MVDMDERKGMALLRDLSIYMWTSDNKEIQRSRSFAKMNGSILSKFYELHPRHRGIKVKNLIQEMGAQFGLEWGEYRDGEGIKLTPQNSTNVISISSLGHTPAQNYPKPTVSSITTTQRWGVIQAMKDLSSYIRSHVKQEGNYALVNEAGSFLGQFYGKYPQHKGLIRKNNVDLFGSMFRLEWIMHGTKNMIALKITETHSTPLNQLASNAAATAKSYNAKDSIQTNAVTISNTDKIKRVTLSNADDVAKMNDFPHLLVDSTDAAAMIVANKLSNATAIGLDIEGDLSPSGRLSLIQVSVYDETSDVIRVYIFDILKCPEILTGTVLPNILSAEHIVKVVHDCRRDSLALSSQYDIELANVFDTQAADMVLTGEGQRRGLNHILQEYAMEVNDLKNDVKHWNGLWDKRPLSHQLLSYAAQDVAYILQAYQEMVSRLQNDGKYELALEESSKNIRKNTQQQADDSDKAPSGLLASEPVGTSKYFQFAADGTAMLSDESFEEETATKSAPHYDANADLDELASILPHDIEDALRSEPTYPLTTEIVLDLGRKPTVRFMIGFESEDPDQISTTCSGNLNCRTVSMADLVSICDHPLIGRFTSDNRAGFSSTLHRVSRKLNRVGDTIALTIRIGRMVEGSTKMITDIVASKRSVLLLGVPGVGKTTLLREFARVVAAANRRVEIIDTSCEIAGDGDVPHVSAGNARRMMVVNRNEQHRVMIEAVLNHMPECIVVDEIGTKAEAVAAEDIAQRGVQLIATAHGVRLQDLLRSGELRGVVGGVHVVVLSDSEARARKLRTKSTQERMREPIFDTIIELRSHHKWVVYHDTAAAVDDILKDKDPVFEIRSINPKTGQMQVTKATSFESKTNNL